MAFDSDETDASQGSSGDDRRMRERVRQVFQGQVFLRPEQAIAKADQLKAMGIILPRREL